MSGSTDKAQAFLAALAAVEARSETMSNNGPVFPGFYARAAYFEGAPADAVAAIAERGAIWYAVLKQSKGEG